MSEHPISGLMGTTLEKIKEMVDSSTIIGDPIKTDDALIIPVSKITYGFASGGSDFPAKSTQKDLFGGGSGAGVTVAPIAFLVIKGDDVKLLQINQNSTSIDKAIELVPDICTKINDMISSKKTDKKRDVKVVPKTDASEQ